MAFKTLEVILFRKKNKKNYLFLHFFLFLPTFYLVLLMEIWKATYNIISAWGERNRTYFVSQKMALRIRQRFLASFNWIFLCCLFLFFLAAEKKWKRTGLSALQRKHW